LLLRSLAPALAAGCTCVIKPAAETSGTHYLLMQAITSCDSLPDGVLNSVNDGGIELSEELVRHPEIDVISFTGSTSTGKRIMETASGTLKRLSLELGGKSPALVFDDANIDNAVSEITKSMLPHCGQMCTALGRAIVHENRLEEFVTKMQRSLSQIVIANAQNPDAQLGPLINAAAVERYLDNVAQGGEEGELLLRGDRATSPTLGSNNFVTPSLVLLQNTQSRLVQQELFAPYLIIETFSDAKDAIKSANATRYGLAASVYTESVRKAQSAARALKSGTVWINCHNRLMVEAETGGYRESGLGRLHGAEGLAPFLETKHIYSQFEAW
jgi:betaine-aldehyde dehydrogenase